MAAQLPDLISIDGQQHDLYTNPLEQYWKVNGITRPSFLPSVECKRGYVASWELINNQLVLKSITGQFIKKYFYFWKRTISCTLENTLRGSSRKDLTAVWFTGKLRVPRGNRLFYVHHDYESRFEQEMILTLEHGKVIKSVVLDYTQKTLQAISIEEQ